MKLTVKLTTAQRKRISSVLDDILALWKKRIAYSGAELGKRQRLAELEEMAVSLEKAANAGDMNASRELLAVKDQIGRVSAGLISPQDDEESEMGAQDPEEDELITEANGLSALALETRKEIARPNAPAHLERITRALAPFFEILHHAKTHAEGCHSYDSLRHFCGSCKVTTQHVELEAAFSQLNHHQGALIELLKTGIVWEFKGSDLPGEGSARDEEEAHEEAEAVAS